MRSLDIKHPIEHSQGLHSMNRKDETGDSFANEVPLIPVLQRGFKYPNSNSEAIAAVAARWRGSARPQVSLRSFKLPPRYSSCVGAIFHKSKVHGKMLNGCNRKFHRYRACSKR